MSYTKRYFEDLIEYYFDHIGIDASQLTDNAYDHIVELIMNDDPIVRPILTDEVRNNIANDFAKREWGN